MKAKVVAILLVAVLLLSGCASKKKDDDGGDGTSATGTSTGTGTKSATGSGTGAPSSGTILVNLTRSTPNGPVPLAVNFTLGATFKDGAGRAVPAPASARWSVTVAAGSGTNATNATAGPAGTALPANFTLNFTATGNHTVRATVTANGYASANGTVLVTAVAGGTGVPLFFDGAEGDTSQWTLQSRVFVNPNLQGSTGQREVAEDHPDGPWTQGGEPRTGAKSWAHPYPDNYRTRMTSVEIPVPAGGATLSYAIKGGAEDTDVEGLFVLAGPADALVEKAHHAGAIADWTVFTVPLAAEDVVVQFRFDSDISCSNDSDAPPGFSCGAGYDAGGFLLDDITVA